MFTDKDLQNLHEMLNVSDELEIIVTPKRYLEAMLARLELAEELLWNVESHGGSDSCDECKAKLIRWRKVAGK